MQQGQGSYKVPVLRLTVLPLRPTLALEGVASQLQEQLRIPVAAAADQGSSLCDMRAFTAPQGNTTAAGHASRALLGK
jgi:hypothetical protein